MLPVEAAILEETSPSSSSTTTAAPAGTGDNAKSSVSLSDAFADHRNSGLDGYVFGGVNSLKFSQISCSGKEVLSRCAARFDVLPTVAEGHTILPAELQRDLDRKTWRLIYEWQQTHTGIKSTRCLAALIINRSDNPVQVLRMEIVEGREVTLLGGKEGFDAESHTILPRGSVIVFAYGFTPNPVDLAHVKIRVFTTAFNSQISTRKDRTNCVAIGGCTARYLEKSLTDWWGKYVILVS